MDKEDRELQIKITQLNAKLQVQIAAVFGFIGAAVGSFVASYEIQNECAKFSLIIVAIISILYGIHYGWELNKTAKSFDRLK